MLHVIERQLRRTGLDQSGANVHVPIGPVVLVEAGPEKCFQKSPVPANAVPARHEDCLRDADGIPVVNQSPFRHKSLGEHEVDVRGAEILCARVLVEML